MKTGDFAGVALRLLSQDKFFLVIAQSKLKLFGSMKLIVMTFSFSQRRSKASEQKIGEVIDSTHRRLGATC